MTGEIDDFGIILIPEDDFGDSCGENNNLWDPGDALETKSKSATLVPFQVNPFSSSSFADELFGFSNQNAYRNSISAHSIHSAITENSNSTVSTLPFPFYSRPTLPHVDDFVQRHELLYSNIRLQMKQERRSKLLNEQLPKSTTDLEVNPSHSSSLMKTAMTTVSSFDSAHFGNEGDQSRGNLTDHQIELFVKYIMVLGEETEYSPSSSSVILTKRKVDITYQDMLIALRMHARSAGKFDKGMDCIQDLLMVSFDDLLFRSNLTHSEWFDENSQGIVGEVYSIPTLRFNKSIRDMCKSHCLPLWSNDDLRVLRLHLSPEGGLEPNLNSVLKCVRKFYSGAEERNQYEGALPIISKIKRLMAQRKHRVMDFFLLIERDPSRAVSPRKLMASIRQLLVPSEDIQSVPYLTDNEIVHNPSKAMRPGVQRSNGAGLPVKVDKLAPLSHELTTRIAEMHAAMQARLNYRKLSETPTPVMTSLNTSTDQTRAVTVKFATQLPAGKRVLAPLPSSPSMMAGARHLECANISANTSLSSVPVSVGGDDRPSRADHLAGTCTHQLSFKLSSSFQSVVGKRTQKLVSSLEQYNSKRERNVNRLAAFF